MNNIKYILNLVGIILLVVMVAAVINFKKGSAYRSLRDKTSESIDGVTKVIKNRENNMFNYTEPERSRPVVLIDLESKLAVFLPEVFEEYDEAKWEEFWDYIYNPITEGIGRNKVTRFRSKDGMERDLGFNHPDTFSKFTEEDWFTFWKLVGLKDKKTPDVVE